MPAESRHHSIIECIADTIRDGTTDAYLVSEIKLADYNENEAPEAGITVSPLGERELLGTNERDDIEYVTLVTRVTHSMGNDDLIEKSKWRSNLRMLFHNKRIECDDACYGYCRVDFGEFAIPKKWFSENKSVSAMRIYTLVRETR